MAIGDHLENSLAFRGERDREDDSLWIFAPKWIAAAFILYGLTAAAFLALNVPPFQVPDEVAHFERAAQIADGVLIGKQVFILGGDGTPHKSAGGSIDPAILSAAAPFDESLWYHPNQQAKRAYWAPNVHWSGRRIPTDFAIEAAYPPFFYMPSALGILIGQAAQLTVVHTLILSRVLTAVSAVAIGAAAIALADGAAPLIFAILTLPMSLFLFASASQDALLIACSAIAGVCLLRAVRWPGVENGKLLIILSLLLTAMAMARPPYAALSLTPLAVPVVPFRRRILAALAIFACAISWAVLGAFTVWLNINLNSVADPPAQLVQLIHHPLLAIHVAFATLSKFEGAYRSEFVGVLGYLDIVLPSAYYKTAQVMLAVAAVTSMISIRGKPLNVSRLLTVATGVAVSFAGIFAIQYLMWTAPGRDIVEGVEGRYFLPLALASPALLPALGVTPIIRFQRPLMLLVLAFPLFSLAVMMRAIVWRYYLG